jgi:2-haloacid dehalogenase
MPDAVIFDLFGTLLEIGSLAQAASAICTEPAAFVATWREKQLAYAFAATIMDDYADFDELTARALDYAVQRHGVVADAAARRTLAAAWERVAPYPDAHTALNALRARGLRCAVLTNGTLATAAAALDSAKLADQIDTVLSVDAVRTYKPAARVYATATAHYATTPDRLVFVTSNGWDAVGAAHAGLRVAWCNRLGAPAETYGAQPTWTIPTLTALPDLISASN